MAESNSARIVIHGAPQAGKPLLAAVDAIQRKVSRKRLRFSRKEIAAQVRATRAERRHRG